MSQVSYKGGDRAITDRALPTGVAPGMTTYRRGDRGLNDRELVATQPPAGPATGACCILGNCSIKTQSACLAAGGTYMGDNSACSAGLCGTAPNTVAGLLAWYNGTFNLNAGQADGTTPSNMLDNSGNGLNLNTAGAGCIFKVNQVNGQPVFRFNNNGYYQRGADINLVQPNTIFVVAKQSSVAAPAFFLDSSSGAGAGANLFLGSGAVPLGANGQYIASNNGYATVLSESGVDRSGAFHVFSAIFNGASSFLYVDGAQVAAGNAGTDKWGNITVGLRVDNLTYGFIGDLAELILYSGALSTANRQGIEKYLKVTYATP